MRDKASIYAPVSAAEIEPSSIAGGVVQGYAAPERGRRPCLLEMVGGSSVVAVARACGFSDAALKAGVRFGWCRFDLGGLTVAAAFGETVQVRCAISGATIASWPPEQLNRSEARPRRASLQVAGLRMFIEELSGCSELIQVEPIAQLFRAEHGDQAFIEASYMYLHKRLPNVSERHHFFDDLPVDWTVTACWEKIVSSNEFITKRRFPLPGVFTSGFPFGLGAFD